MNRITATHRIDDLTTAVTLDDSFSCTVSRRDYGAGRVRFAVDSYIGNASDSAETGGCRTLGGAIEACFD
jgi:hypothetical protein